MIVCKCIGYFLLEVDAGGTKLSFSERHRYSGGCVPAFESSDFKVIQTWVQILAYLGKSYEYLPRASTYLLHIQYSYLEKKATSALAVFVFIRILLVESNENPAQ